MKFNSILYTVLFAALFISGCSYQIGKEVMAEISGAESDGAIITPNMAVFAFRVDTKGSWQWYRSETETGQGEYGWWVNFSLGDDHYSCGYRLFKHPFAEPTSGTFKQLIEAGQTDLSSSSSPASMGPKNDGSYVAVRMSKRIEGAKVDAIVRSDKLIILLKEQKLVNKFIDLKIDSVLVHKDAGMKETDHKKIKVTYSLSE